VPNGIVSRLLLIKSSYNINTNRKGKRKARRETGRVKYQVYEMFANNMHKMHATSEFGFAQVQVKNVSSEE